MDTQQLGKTKDQGWEIGVRRTFPIGAEEAWNLLVDQQGLSIWLGEDPDLKLEKGATFETTDGTTGRIVSIREGTLLRMRWQPRSFADPSTLQMRVIAKGDKATISIHHERLANAAQREEMKQHWGMVLNNIQTLIGKEL